MAKRNACVRDYITSDRTMTEPETEPASSEVPLCRRACDPNVVVLSVSFEAWGLRGPELLCSVSDVILPSALTNGLSVHPDVPITFNGALATPNGKSYFAFAFVRSFYGCISLYISLFLLVGWSF